MRLHWHRSDLRLHDNPAVAGGDTDETLQPVFVFDPDVLEHASSVRARFLVDSLRDLGETYRDRGYSLRIMHDDPASALPEAADSDDTVTWNRGYTPLARRRQNEVSEALDAEDLSHEAFDGGVLHPPTEIYSQADEPYSTFSYYHDSWLDLPVEEPHPEPGYPPADADPGSTVPSVEELGFRQPTADVPSGGVSEGRRRLDEFCSHDIYRYADHRDQPAEDATSRLSPHLRFGTVGVREVLRAIAEAREEADGDDERAGVDEFRRQLCFREFYLQMLYHHPDTVRESHRPEPDWRDAEQEVERWRRGRTGYPFVDAGMRQLLEEAWMHNRVRMAAASFLTRHLLVDWRVGLDWFRRKLVDHDTANDVAGWQWTASTGVDRQPYFRIFNPTSQCRKHDPEAEYVREYVPELRDVSTEDVHRMPELDDAEREEVAPEYPAPVVDHSAARERALEAFEDARE